MAEIQERRDPSPTQTAISEVAAAVAQSAKAERVKRLDLDVRGLLAIMVLIGTLLLATISLIMAQTLDLPSWLTGIAGSVVGFYFGSKGGSSTNGSH